MRGKGGRGGWTEATGNAAVMGESLDGARRSEGQVKGTAGAFSSEGSQTERRRLP